VRPEGLSRNLWWDLGAEGAKGDACRAEENNGNAKNSSFLQNSK